MATYVVLREGTVAKDLDGRQHSLSEGNLLPANADPEHIKHLLGLGFIEKSAASNDDGPPAKSATKDEWVTFAEAQGDDDAADKTKEQLIADHGDN